MQAHSYGKYVLKDLHEAIDSFSRKIIDCETQEVFESTGDRAAALQKLSSKRAALVRTVLALTGFDAGADPRVRLGSFAEPAEQPSSELVPQIGKTPGTKAGRPAKAAR